MDKRIKYRVVLDCETCPLDRELDKVEPSNMFVYDLGWAIVDKRGNVYRTRSYVVADIFLDEKALMKSAYYADKIPKYWEDIKSGKRILTSFYNIRKQLMEDMKEYGVDEVYAHNMRFDYGALNNTYRWLTKSKCRNFFHYDTKICDTLKMAREVVAKTPTYQRFCKEHGYVTARNQVQLKAETLYRYIKQDTDFVESHTGLEDVLIEKDIMAYCFRKHKKMSRLLWERG